MMMIQRFAALFELGFQAGLQRDDSTSTASRSVPARPIFEFVGEESAERD